MDKWERGKELLPIIEQYLAEVKKRSEQVQKDEDDERKSGIQSGLFYVSDMMESRYDIYVAPDDEFSLTEEETYEMSVYSAQSFLDNLADRIDSLETKTGQSDFEAGCLESYRAEYKIAVEAFSPYLDEGWDLV
ncbi:MAG: hypothetical protein HFE45_13000 [Oscillospiraceae bacterium]|nr:hypothetical protein [Oscillospiraceae bacterium]